MSHVAFALREEYQGTVTAHSAAPVKPGEEPELIDDDIFHGGLLSIPPDDRPFGVKDELAKGGGVIVVDADDEPLVAALRAYPALEEVPVPEGATG
jgi:hypothetical protein